ncbi:MAG: SDR family NAD(P)-dependent oxidoreductase [Candidatus Promineifilaceae bacterium]|nr:SDR family NAD(P)-dependent oxidoreductase [Candidatus Promineifilaceae bacterium]
MRIANQLILVTGASSGIGAATARAMAARGGRVLLLARNAVALQQVAAQIDGAGGWAQVHPVDLTIPAAVASTTDQILTGAGPPDVIVNNAGAGRWLTVPETEPAEAVQMMAVPYFAAFFVTRAFLPAMLARDSGQIVNVTSPAAFVPWPGATGYTATRWAMRGFTKALQADLHHTGLTVTLLTAGVTDTPYFEHNPGTAERLPAISRLFPTLTAEQVAAAIIAAVEQGQTTVTIPTRLRLALWAHRLVPGLIEWLTIHSGWRLAEESRPRNR